MGCACAGPTSAPGSAVPPSKLCPAPQTHLLLWNSPPQLALVQVLSGGGSQFQRTTKDVRVRPQVKRLLSELDGVGGKSFLCHPPGSGHIYILYIPYISYTGYPEGLVWHGPCQTFYRGCGPCQSAYCSLTSAKVRYDTSTTTHQSIPTCSPPPGGGGSASNRYGSVWFISVYFPLKTRKSKRLFLYPIVVRPRSFGLPRNIWQPISTCYLALESSQED